MSGHSKFANIKHKKEKNDAKKGKIFTVIGRELVMAVKAGGPDPNNNSKLRDVIAKRKQTTCQTIQLNVVSKKQQVLILQITTRKLYMKDMVRTVLLSLLRL